MDLKEICERLLTVSQTSEMFFDTVAELSSGRRDEMVGNALVALQTQHNVDVVRLALQIKKAQGGFWMVVDPLLFAVARLARSADEFLQCMRHLRKEMGNDGYVARVLGCAKEFCGQDETRGLEFIELCVANPVDSVDFLPPALVGLSELDFAKAHSRAIVLCQASDIPLQSVGAFTLGILNYSTHPESLDTTIAELERLAGSPEVTVQTSTIRSADTLLCTHKEVRLQTIIVRLSASDFSAVKQWTAKALAEQVSAHAERWFRECLQNLQFIESDKIASYSSLDDVLEKLMGIDHARVLEFLDGWVQQQKISKGLFVFKQLAHHLLLHPLELEFFITHWFIAGQEAQHWLAADLLSQYSTKTGQSASIAALSFDRDILNALSVEDAEVMIRRVIGHCFTHPKLLCSLVFSVLKKSRDKRRVETMVIHYFVTIIGYNYFGTLDVFLAERSKFATQRERRVAAAIRSGMNAYIDALQALPRLKEYSSSPLRMQKYAMAQNKQMAESMKKTEKEGDFIFSKIAKKLPMKCGRSFFFKQTVGPTPTDVRLADPTPLKAFSVTWEVPRHYSIDPIGCEYELHEMRTESRMDKGKP